MASVPSKLWRPPELTWSEPPPLSLMPITVALAGDTMLGRGVAERLQSEPPESLVAPEVVAAIQEADLFVLNLECCISDRGRRWPRPGKPFFFRAPPAAVRLLTHLGVDCVTLANNHVLDFGEEALLDTLALLDDAGIAHVGAGVDFDLATCPALLEADGVRLAVIGIGDHPEDFAATCDRPGIAYHDLHSGMPEWMVRMIGSFRSTGAAVLVTPHWGPNMATSPLAHVRKAASDFVDAGATFVTGHSAHVFQGIEGRILFDLGDFIDDYAVDPILRNDLGLLFLVTLDEQGPIRLEAVPLKLDYCYTRPADGEDARWIRERFTIACAEFETDVAQDDGRIVVAWR
jgi:poly-gamma-glutamate capsule biosynthesis protein CapA/YwtB (metallophosphatase superfamily)